MDNFYLLTYIDEKIKLDIVNRINLDKIKIMAIDSDYFNNLNENNKKNKIVMLAIEPYSIIKLKIDTLEDFIKTNK